MRGTATSTSRTYLDQEKATFETLQLKDRLELRLVAALSPMTIACTSFGSATPATAADQFRIDMRRPIEPENISRLFQILTSQLGQPLRRDHRDITLRRDCRRILPFEIGTDTRLRNRRNVIGSLDGMRRQ